MRRKIWLIPVLLLGSGLSLAKGAEEATFHAYVDSEICARLMLGPITDRRIECSRNTVKQGDQPALVRISDNAVFEVRNRKTVKPLVGEFVAVTGQLNEKNGKIKVASAEPVGRADIPKGEVDANLMDVRNYRSSGDKVFEEVRHKLAMMPYISEFDFISFAMAGDQVILKPTLWGDFSADWQPLSRFRMVERFTTRRLHISGASALLSTFEDVRPVLGGAIEDPLEIPAFPDSFLAMSLETQELTGFVYPQSRLQIHVGHRYQTRKIKETGQFRAERNVLLLGAAYRLSPGYRVSADYEYGRTDQAIYRLDAVDFQRVRISGEAKPLNKLRVSGNALVFSNDNDLDSIDFTHRTRDFGFNFDYAPVSRFSVSGGFQRTRLTSDLLIIVPQTFLPARSFFRERGNYGELWTNLVLPRRASLRVGYSVWGTTGNFPNTYHRPVARLEIPLGERVVAYARWNYYGYNEKLDLFPQDYRTHLVVFGFRVDLKTQDIK